MSFNPLIYTDDYVRVRAIPNSHTSTVIFCHGKGQKGGDWLFIVDRLRQLGRLDHVAFIFPYLTYDAENSGLKSNSKLIQWIVAEEVKKGISNDRIAIGGFKEGVDVLLLAALTDNTKIAGIAGLAESIAITKGMISERTAANEKTLIMLTTRAGEKASIAKENALEVVGQSIDFRIHDVVLQTEENQNITPQEIKDFGTFLHKVLPVEKK